MLYVSRPLGRAARRQTFRCACASAAPPQVGEGTPAKSASKGKGGKSFQNPDANKTSDEIREQRAAKATALRKAGQNPFAYRYDRTALAAELQAAHADLPAGQEVPGGVVVAVAGRVMTRRVMGKLAFVTLRDASGTIQLYVDKSRLEGQAEAFKELKTLVDAGDIVGVRGGLRRTDKGELSVVARTIEVLTKSHRMLPDKFHGLQDVEKRYRQRYVDMIANPEVQGIFRSRSMITSTLRRVLEDEGFLEVETPVLESVAGGADARPFVTHHNALGQNFSLRIATELHLKRMLVGGFERVFEIGRIFRNEGVSARHNPEFTSIEVYQAYADYEDMMQLTQSLIQAAAQRVHGSAIIPFGEEGVMDLSKPFRRVSMHELVLEATGTDFWDLCSDLEGTRAAAEAALDNSACAGPSDRQAVVTAGSPGAIVNALFEALVEATLQEPTFVLDYPEEISPLAKPHRSMPGLVERFELFVAGRELANSFSELTDPIEQRRRLEQQIEVHRKARAAGVVARENGGKDHEIDYDIELDNDFLTALEYGMPPAGGMGMGIDRLVMLLTNSASIRDVIAFPLMK